jgi:hypothetical protein
MKPIRCAAILDTMWGNAGRAPRWFVINPSNHSGRRLYWLLDHESLLVTNACKEQVGHSTIHGTPDPAWLAENLQRVSYDLLLVCGRIAQMTFAICGYRPICRILEMPHPASRTWTRFRLDAYRAIIQTGIH